MVEGTSSGGFSQDEVQTLTKEVHTQKKVRGNFTRLVSLMNHEVHHQIGNLSLKMKSIEHFMKERKSESALNFTNEIRARDQSGKVILKVLWVICRNPDTNSPPYCYITSNMQESVDGVLGNSSYQHSQVNQWTSNIVEATLAQLTKLNKPYKYIVTCVIMQKNGAGLHLASSCYWDNTTDDIFLSRGAAKLDFYIASIIDEGESLEPHKAVNYVGSCSSGREELQLHEQVTKTGFFMALLGYGYLDFCITSIIDELEAVATS